MSSTFAQLRTKVSRKILDPNNTAIVAADVGDAINDALAYWKYQRLWFNEAYAQATLVVGQGNFTDLLPDDFLYEFPEDGFNIPYSQITYPLFKKSPQIFDTTAIEDAVGLPYIYTTRNQNYELYFNPQLPYLLNMYYIQDQAPFINDGDTNAFSEYADQLLIYEACSRLMGEDRQDLQMNNTYAAKADREAKNLRQRTFKQTASGSLTIETIID